MLRIFIFCCNDTSDKSRSMLLFVYFCNSDFFLYGPFEGGD